MSRKGRPSTYTPEIADRICAELAEGKSLVKICAKSGMPNCATVFRWLQVTPEFRENYTRAREAQADYYAAQIADIADACRIGQKTKRLPDGKVEVTTGDMVERSRLMVDARKWLAGKLAPKKYGDRLELAGNKDAPLVISVAERIRGRLAERRQLPAAPEE